MKRKSHQHWSWIILASFVILGYFYPVIGLSGIICMIMPPFHAFLGRGKIHCSHYCPRGSLLGKFLKYVSLNNPLPNVMRTKGVKNILLLLMLSLLSLSLFHSKGNILKISFSIYRFMTLSLLVGITLGTIFKPRSWCQICPMGHLSDLVDKAVKNGFQISKKLEGTN